jgi:hypothetical protein
MAQMLCYPFDTLSLPDIPVTSNAKTNKRQKGWWYRT